MSDPSQQNSAVCGHQWFPTPRHPRE